MPHDLEQESGVFYGIQKKLNPDELRLLSQLFCRDPFGDMYKKALLVYVVSLFLIVFWPFKFTSWPPKNNAEWISNSVGIEFPKAGQVISALPAKSLFESLTSGSGFAVELWVNAAKNEQYGPARIVSYSLNSSLRNFTIGQEGKDLMIRLRTTETNLNGSDPVLTVKNVFRKQEPLHLAVSYNYDEQKVYINGRLRLTSNIPGGDFSNWDSRHKLVFGNEATGDRPWLGEIYYAAVYNKPLQAKRIKKSYDEIHDWLFDNAKPPLSKQAPLCQYLFTEQRGDILKNSGSLGDTLDLHIPERIERREKPFLEFSLERFKDGNRSAFYEVILNVLLFMPFSFFLHAMVANQSIKAWKPFFIVIVAGGLITLLIETVQFFADSRHSSLVDVAANMIGVFLGVGLKQAYDIHIKRCRASIREKSDLLISAVHRQE